MQTSLNGLHYIVQKFNYIVSPGLFHEINYKLEKKRCGNLRTNDFDAMFLNLINYMECFFSVSMTF